MWTKRNDHAPKIEGVEFLSICPKRKILSKNNFKFDHSLVFSSPKKIIEKCHNNISLLWAFVFFYYSTSFASPTAKLVGPCQWIM